jgi:hypothetical protein
MNLGMFDKLMGEFVDIIEWLDSTNDTMAYRFQRLMTKVSPSSPNYKIAQQKIAEYQNYLNYARQRANKTIP